MEPGSLPRTRWPWCRSLDLQACSTACHRLLRTGWLTRSLVHPCTLPPSLRRRLWGSQANEVTIWQLATMTSGVLDFDTAKPSDSDPSHSVDPFRATVYETASKDWTPQVRPAWAWI